MHRSVQDRLKEAEADPPDAASPARPRRPPQILRRLGPTPGGHGHGQSHQDLFEANFERNLANRSDQLLVDVVGQRGRASRDRSGASPGRPGEPDKTLKAKPDDLMARLPGPWPTCGWERRRRPSTISRP